MASVPSVEALSQMMSSKSEKVWARSESSDWASHLAPLYTGRPMLTRGGTPEDILRPDCPESSTMVDRSASPWERRRALRRIRESASNQSLAGGLDTSIANRGSLREGVV